jgi:glycosyltransferase involved in cell wall biosynthesis
VVTDSPLSILHVLAPADAGGLETVVKALALGHAAMGHSVELAAVLSQPASPFVEEARDAGIKVRIVISPPRSVLPERREVRALLARGNADVLHSHGYRSDILDLGIARRLGVASATTLHGFSATDSKARIYEWLQLRSARRASAIVAVSSNVAARAIGSGARPESVHLIRNAATPPSYTIGADEARNRLQLGDGINVAWIGRLSAEKGPDVMIETMAHITDLPIKLSFIGDGSDRTPLERRAADLGVAASVRFHGRVANAAGLLPAFDLLVLSSRTEGTPMVILEAMAAGVPIVATRVGGIPDMLSSREAILVASDDPKALAAAIRTALDDPAASLSRAALAKERLKAEFTMEAWLERYESLYRSIKIHKGDVSR